MKTLIKNIKAIYSCFEQNPVFLKGEQMKALPRIDNAFLVINDGIIWDYGEMTLCPFNDGFDYVIDATGKYILPAFCDSHTHLVFPDTREEEFVMRIQGMTYEEIARRGGGIINSALKLRNLSEDELFEEALVRLRNVVSYGTGAIEIKSGYGLNLESELKMLRVIKRLKESTSVTIKATFLAAHAVPPEYAGRKNDYVEHIINEMLPEVAKENLADFIDVFCDKGFFNVEDTNRILEAAARYGILPKIHANELDNSGGVQVGVKNNAVSVDHLERVGEEEIECLQQGDTVPTLLPQTSFFLGIPYAPARKMIDAGLGIALASDYNPGSAPSGNMQFVISLACIKYKLLPEEAINAATLNGAKAMQLEGELGTITRGKKANLLITQPVKSIAVLPYEFADNSIDTVIIDGKIFK